MFELTYAKAFMYAYHINEKLKHKPALREYVHAAVVNEYGDVVSMSLWQSEAHYAVLLYIHDSLDTIETLRKLGILRLMRHLHITYVYA
jgi:hypothetical protein